jgi:hypothetical protein
MTTKHFVLCSWELFAGPKNLKSHFSAVQCFLELSELTLTLPQDTGISAANLDNESTIDNPEARHLDNQLSGLITTGLPLTLPPHQFALIGILGPLSNFPQTGRHLKNVFRLHALGDSLELAEARGYDFAYKRFREYVTSWKAAKKCAYRERDGLKAKKIKRGEDEGVRKFRQRDGGAGREARRVRQRGKRRVDEGVIGEAAALDCGADGDIMSDDEKDAEIPEEVEMENAGATGTTPAPSLPHSHYSHHDDPHHVPVATAPRTPPRSPACASPSYSARGSPFHPNPFPLGPIPNLPLRPSFLALGALFSICQQPNRNNLRTWEIPIEVKQTLPTEKNGRFYPTFRVFYKARLVEGVRLLKIEEPRPKSNYKNCPYGCVEFQNRTHQWFSSSK